MPKNARTGLKDFWNYPMASILMTPYNNAAKAGGSRKIRVKNKKELQIALRSYPHSTQRRPESVKSFFKDSHVLAQAAQCSAFYALGSIPLLGIYLNWLLALFISFLFFFITYLFLRSESIYSSNRAS